MSHDYQGRASTHAGTRTSGERARDEIAAPTSEERAGHAANVAANLARHVAHTRDRITALATATPAAHASARELAERAVDSLRDLVVTAATFARAATDPAVTQQLADAPRQLADLEAQLARAPEPTATAAAGSPGVDRFVRALPGADAPRRQDGPAVVGPLVAAIDGLVFEELDPLAHALATDEPTRARFERLSERARREVRTALMHPTRRARLLDAHNAQIRGVRPAPAAAGAGASTATPEAVSLRVDADAPDPAQATASELGRALGVAPRLVLGDEGRAATEAHGGRGVAQGDTVALHPELDPTSTDGRQVIAHELIHHAQAALPEAADAGRDEAETEAAELAPAVAAGQPHARPRRRLDLSRPAGNNDARGRKAARDPDLATAISALDEAIGLAVMALARANPDASIERAVMAADALAEVRHRHGGTLAKADEDALARVAAQGQRLIHELTVGTNARPRLAKRLRERLAELAHVVDDRSDDAQETRDPSMLVMFASDSLVALRRSQLYLTGYPGADASALDAPIAETQDWLGALAGEHARKRAAKLTGAVLSQAKVVNQVAPEIQRFVSEPPTMSSPEVAAAYVEALALSTHRIEQAERAVERARKLRQHQRNDAARAVIDQNQSDALAVAELDHGAAMRKQGKLEARLAAFDERIRRGGTVGPTEREELYLAAREQSFRNQLQRLEHDLTTNAAGLDSLDDGLLGGVNRYSDDLPNLVSDLRGLARILASAVKGYEVRAELVERDGDEIADERERRKKVTAGKLAALDEMAAIVQQHVLSGRLQERLKAAERASKSAQTRLFLANVGVTVVLTLTGNALASAARGGAEGMYLARAGAVGADAAEAMNTARTVGTVAAIATDTAVNTLGQKYVLGDNRDLWTLLASNAAGMATAHVVMTRFPAAETLIAKADEVAHGWKQILLRFAKRVAKRGAIRGVNLVSDLPTLSLAMVVGGATDHAITRMAGYQVPPGDKDALVSEWMAQGAAMALARHVSAHSKGFKRLTDRIQDGARRFAHAQTLASDLATRGAWVEATGRVADAEALLVQYDVLLGVERAMQAKLAGEGDANRSVPDDTLEPPRERATQDAATPAPESRTSDAPTHDSAAAREPATTAGDATAPEADAAAHATSHGDDDALIPATAEEYVGIQRLWGLLTQLDDAKHPLDGSPPVRAAIRVVSDQITAVLDALGVTGMGAGRLEGLVKKRLSPRENEVLRDQFLDPRPGRQHVVGDADRDGISDGARVGVPAHEIPDTIPRLDGLPPEAATAQADFAGKWEAPRGREKLSRDYRSIVDAEIDPDDGHRRSPEERKTFATDDAKRLSPDYNRRTGTAEEKNAAKATMNLAVHATANAIAKEAFLARLDQLAETQPGAMIMVTAGGVAAGKSHAIRNNAQAKAMVDRAAVIWDSAGEQNATELPWVLAEATRRGLTVEVLYVHQTPEQSWPRVISRAGKEGRMVDARLHAESYAEGGRNFDAFQRQFPEVRTLVIDVTGNKPGAIESLPADARAIDADTQHQANTESLTQQPDVPPHVRTGGAEQGEAAFGPPAHRALVAELREIPYGRLGAGVVPEGRTQPLDRDTYYLSHADGKRMLALLVQLGPQYETIAYRRGFLLRAGAGGEWYFEFRDAAAGLEPVGARDARGLPEPNAATVTLYVYSGVRTIGGRPRDQWTPAEKAEVARVKQFATLGWAGHVGISIDGGKTIWGFTPHLPEGTSLQAGLESLQNHDAYPGVLGDDTAAFREAAALARDRGWDTQVLSAVELVDAPAKLATIAEIARLSGMEPGEHGFGYSFPLKPHERGPDGEAFRASNGFPADCVRNCGAFPEKLGVAIPERSGQIKDLMGPMTEWANADGPMDFRTRDAPGAER